ncbi:MAG: plasmid pRiA4b ORF-3 family protein [Ktedonobacteraceae bacterium]
MPRRPTTERVYELDIRLIDIEPPIWWQITVSDQITLAVLHHVLQVVMGWEYSHLHQFVVGETHYGEPDPEFDDDLEIKDDRRFKLRDIAREKGANFVYEYDFGDFWQHRVIVEDSWPRTENSLAPRCFESGRACPPEDCGEVSGYQNLLEALHDRRHPEHRELRAWAGPHYNPELFSVQAVNSALALLVALGVTR